MCGQTHRTWQSGLLFKDVKKRFNPSNYEHDKLVIEARVAVLDGKTDKAKALLQESEELSLGKTLSPSALLTEPELILKAAILR